MPRTTNDESLEKEERERELLSPGFSGRHQCEAKQVRPGAATAPPLGLAPTSAGSRGRDSHFSLASWRPREEFPFGERASERAREQGKRVEAQAVRPRTTFQRRRRPWRSASRPKPTRSLGTACSYFSHGVGAGGDEVEEEALEAHVVKVLVWQ